MIRCVLPFTLIVAVLGQAPPTSQPTEETRKAAGVLPSEAPPLDELAQKIAAAYAAKGSLDVESRVFESVQLGRAELTFDEKAPQIATIKSSMRPDHELRTEVFVEGKSVWGMVAQPMEKGKDSRAVQWNPRQITKPYQAGRFADGRGTNVADGVPGRCILGWHIYSLAGGIAANRDTWPSGLWKDRITEGKYEGLVETVAGGRCYCILTTISSTDAGEEALFRHYVDPKTFLLAQIDKVQLVWNDRNKVVGVASQRWTFSNTELTVAPDKKVFEFPAREGREEVKAKER